MSHLSNMLPRISPPPADDDQLPDWIGAFYREFDRWTKQLCLAVNDHTIHGGVTHSLLVDGFSVKAEPFFHHLFANGNVTSDVAVAISPAQQEGIWVCFVNMSAFNITFKNGAKTVFRAGVDFVLAPNMTLTMHYDGSIDKWLQVAP